MELFLLGCLPRDYCYTAFIPLGCDGDFFQSKGKIPVSKRSWRKTHSCPDKMSNDNKWAFYFKQNLFPSWNHTCQFKAQRFLPCILLKQGPMHICSEARSAELSNMFPGKWKKQVRIEFQKPNSKFNSKSHFQIYENSPPPKQKCIFT